MDTTGIERIQISCVGQEIALGEQLVFFGRIVIVIVFLYLFTNEVFVPGILFFRGKFCLL